MADMLRSVLDAMPALVFVVDHDVRIQDYNAAAGEFLSAKRTAIIKRRGGEVLHCVHATDVPEGCGRGPFCTNCIIRNSVEKAFDGHRVVRRRAKMEILREATMLEIYALVTSSPFRFEEKNDTANYLIVT